MRQTIRGPTGRPKGPGSQRVYEVVRERILRLEMPPGSSIDETALVAEFRVSRTPVREALIRLATDGFVTLLPNRGASVSPLSVDELPELLDAMEVCQRVTSRWAAVRRTAADLDVIRGHQRDLDAASARDDDIAMSNANAAFHLAIARASRNRHMVRLFEGLIPQYYRLTITMLSAARQNAPSYKEYFFEISDEHDRLIAAIAARDSAAADRLAQAHVGLIGQRLQAFVWSSTPNPIELLDPRVAP